MTGASFGWPCLHFELVGVELEVYVLLGVLAVLTSLQEPCCCFEASQESV